MNEIPDLPSALAYLGASETEYPPPTLALLPMAVQAAREAARQLGAEPEPQLRYYLANEALFALQDGLDLIAARRRAFALYEAVLQARRRFRYPMRFLCKGSDLLKVYAGDSPEALLDQMAPDYPDWSGARWEGDDRGRTDHQDLITTFLGRPDTDPNEWWLDAAMLVSRLVDEGRLIPLDPKDPYYYAYEQQRLRERWLALPPDPERDRRVGNLLSLLPPPAEFIQGVRERGEAYLDLLLAP